MKPECALPAQGVDRTLNNDTGARGLGLTFSCFDGLTLRA